eukprot:250418-Rhodomonas_salina.1
MGEAHGCACGKRGPAQGWKGDLQQATKPCLPGGLSLVHLPRRSSVTATNRHPSQNKSTSDPPGSSGARAGGASRGQEIVESRCGCCGGRGGAEGRGANG